MGRGVTFEPAQPVAGEQVTLTWTPTTDVSGDPSGDVQILRKSAEGGSKTIAPQGIVTTGATGVRFSFPTDLGFAHDASSDLVFQRTDFFGGAEACAGIATCRGPFYRETESLPFRLP